MPLIEYLLPNQTLNNDCLFVPDPRRCHCCRFDRATWITLAMVPGDDDETAIRVPHPYGAQAPFKAGAVKQAESN